MTSRHEDGWHIPDEPEPDDSDPDFDRKNQIENNISERRTIYFGDLHGPEGNVFEVLSKVKTLFHPEEEKADLERLIDELNKLSYDDVLEWIEELCKKHRFTIYAANWRGKNTDMVRVVQ